MFSFPSGHKQESLRAVTLFPRQGRGHGIHHSLWLNYTSAQPKVKAITGLSLPLRPPCSPPHKTPLSFLTWPGSSLLHHSVGFSPTLILAYILFLFEVNFSFSTWHTFLTEIALFYKPFVWHSFNRNTELCFKVKVKLFCPTSGSIAAQFPQQTGVIGGFPGSVSAAELTGLLSCKLMFNDV